MLPEGPLVKEKRGAGSGRPVDAKKDSRAQESRKRADKSLLVLGSEARLFPEVCRGGRRRGGVTATSDLCGCPVALLQEEGPMTTILDFNNTEERLERIKDWSSRILPWKPRALR